MNTQRICQRCRSPRAADAPEGVCPTCLLAVALEDPTEAPTLPASQTGSISALPSGPPRPGEDFGPYHIIRVLGRGGMGEVFEAEHLSSGRRVALKVMNHALASEADRKRFLREGRIAASVSHPNAVYIFGSEEIRGTPVIAMELVAGGTLKDRIKRSGPLPISEAVESVLHVIDGLEAAHAAGVLHRDIKPANCFITADGVVKVGDFGLSISTIARGESLLTASGSVLGTPAYASPEQLRGEDLDVASDIYSVGATLYHLLTGRPPHETTDFIKLITEVLDKAPASPDKLRAEIPAGLAKVVQRSLAKNRSLRYSSYAAFRNALLPFISTAPAPAVLGLRFVAGVIDECIGWLPSVIWLVVTGQDAFDSVISDRTWNAVWIAGGFYLFALLYYAIPEGLWGASFGKALLGLRVVGPNRLAPGISRALLRVLLFSSPAVAAVVGSVLVHTPAEFLARQESSGLTAYLPFWLVTTIALWITIRRRNGYAGLHDLATGTRVIARHSAHERPRLSFARSAAPSASPASTNAVPQTPEPLGPYEIVRPLGSSDGAELLLARDPVLRRFVWIRKLQPGAPAVSARRRDLNRPGRLRWLNGHRDEIAAWDAYESPDGRPWIGLMGDTQPWAAVRFWIDDLVREIAAGNQTDSAVPELADDRIWITEAGRALLLDFPYPTTTPGMRLAPVSPTDFPAVQRFLHRLAVEAMSAGVQTAGALLPLHARSFLQNLSEARFEEPNFLLGNMGSLLDKPPAVSRQRRAAALFFAPAFALLVGLVVGGLLQFSHKRSLRDWPEAQFPGSTELRGELRLLDYLLLDHDSHRAFRTHIATHHREIVLNTNFWAHPKVKETLTTDNRKAATEAVHDYADATPERIAAADLLVNASQAERLVGYFVGVGVFWFVLTLMALVDLFCSFVLGHDFFLHLLGIAAVRRAGVPANRLLLLWRNTLAWGFCYAALPASFIWWAWFVAIPLSTPVTLLVGLILPVLVVTMTALTLRRPARGLQDWLAGTRLVPR